MNSPTVNKKETATLEVMLNCDKCDYKCKKEITLKKHIHTKHEDQQCKQCSEIFKSSTELVMYTAKDHSSNINDDVAEPRNQAKWKTLEVKESNKSEESLDNDKCSECKDKLTEKNTSKDHAGKCSL